MTQATVPFRHPLLRCLDDVVAALDSVADADPAYLSTDAKRELLLGLTNEITRLEGHRLAVLAVAGDVAEEAGARSAGAWLAHETRLDSRARGDGSSGWRTRSATRHPAVGAAVRAGKVDVFRAAEIVVASLDDLPSDLPPDIRASGPSARLVAACRATSSRVGCGCWADGSWRWSLPRSPTSTSGRLLEREEQYARSRMQITTHDLGRGLVPGDRRPTERDHGPLDDPAPVLHRPAACPSRDRRRSTGRAGRPGHGGTGSLPPAAGAGIHRACWSRARTDCRARRGDATAAVLVTIEPRSSPSTGSVRPSCRPAARISAGECTSDWPATRTSCPAVLGGESQTARPRPGPASVQARPSARRWRSATAECRTDGCDIPAAWCEAHHLIDRGPPAARPTWRDGVLLCSFHHHRAHDRRYDMKWLPNGDVRFHRRR